MREEYRLVKKFKRLMLLIKDLLQGHKYYAFETLMHIPHPNVQQFVSNILTHKAKISLEYQITPLQHYGFLCDFEKNIIMKDYKLMLGGELRILLLLSFQYTPTICRMIPAVYIDEEGEFLCASFESTRRFESYDEVHVTVWYLFKVYGTSAREIIINSNEWKATRNEIIIPPYSFYPF